MEQLINNQSIIIYNNYTSFASIVEEKENYHSLLSKAGSENACEAVLDHIQNSKYYESLIQVCKVDSIYEVMFSYLQDLKCKSLICLNFFFHDFFREFRRRLY